MDNELLIGAVAVVAAVTVMCCKVVMKAKKPVPDTESKWKELIENQNVYQGANDMTRWFSDNRNMVDGEAVFFLAKPTPAVSAMFALGHVPKGLDVNNNLLQAVVNKKSLKVAAVRLVSFDKVPEKIADKLKTKDYMIINE